MAGKKSDVTKEDKNIEKEIREEEYLPQYDTDTVEGEVWKKCFADILNKRFIDGWEYLPPYMRTGMNESKSCTPYFYTILYKRRIHI